MTGWDVLVFIGAGLATVLSVLLVAQCVEENWRARHRPLRRQR